MSIVKTIASAAAANPREAMNLVGVDPVLDPVAAAAHILAQRPEMIPTLPSFSMPEFAAFGPLAEVVGACGQSRLDAAANLAAHRAEISDALAAGALSAGAATTQLTSIATGLTTRAAAASAIAVSPAGPVGAAAFVAGAVADALRSAADVLQQLESEMRRIAERLEAATAKAMADKTPGPGAGGGEAARQLAGFAEASAPPEVAPAAAAPPATEPGSSSPVGSAAVEAAKSQLGTPYVWGGSAPGGFDCSGLTSWAYRQAGMEIPRIAADQAMGRQVSYDELQPGDLAVWDGHVAMYAGDGMYIEAGDPVSLNPVRTDNIGMTFRGFWRPTG